MKKAPVKKIKENITLKEYKQLMNSIRGSQSTRENTRSNLLRTFCLLFDTGLRLNELQELRVINIKEFINDGTTKLILSKMH